MNFEFIYIIVLLCFGAIIEIFVCKLTDFTVDKIYEKKYEDGPHYCNHCRLSFLRKENIFYTYCPNCGKHLHEYDVEEEQ